MGRMLRVFMCVFLFTYACNAWAESSVWKVQKNGHTLYLAGTSHVLRDQDFPLPAEFDIAYQAADHLIFETDIGAMEQADTQRKLMEAAIYQDGSTLKDHLSEKSWKMLEAYCNKNGIPLGMLATLRPSMATTVLLIQKLTQLGVGEQGVDQFYYAKAMKDGKTTGALESVETQIDILMHMGEGHENEFITYSLEDMNTIEQDFTMLVNAWRSGNTQGLEKMMLKNLTVMPDLYQTMLVDRNNSWLPIIEQHANANQTTLVLVGAAHLVGKDGILQNMQRRGYKITQIKAPKGK